MGDLSPHFNRRELACRCGCGQIAVNQILISALEELRRLAGGPVIVTSGYRCPKHNALMGGAKNSLHVQGKAADVQIPGLTVKEMYELACQVEGFKKGGLGVYPEGFIHVDVRDEPGRWARVNGHYVGLDAVGLA